MDAFERIDLAVCGTVAMLMAAAYGLTKSDKSEFADSEPQPDLAEKIMIWIIVGMMSSILLAAVVVRHP